MTRRKRDDTNSETFETRRKKVSGFGYWFKKFHVLWMLLVFGLLPFAMQGTEHYESALDVRRYGLLGIGIGWLQYGWLGLVIKIHARLGRPIGYNLLTAYCLSAGVLCIPILYAGIRVTGPDAPLAALRAFSWTDAYAAALISLVGSCIIGFLLHSTVAYLRGESVLYVNQPSKPSTFWLAIVLPVALLFAWLLWLLIAKWSV